ncbi:MAG: flagellar type III secretion system protein FlhB [Burkholderiaceae bacterium]
MAENEQSSEDRDLPATARRLQKAAQEGQVPRSRDVGHALVMGAAVAAFGLMGPALANSVVQIVRTSMHFTPRQVHEPALMGVRLYEHALQGMAAAVPLMGLLVLVAAAACLIPGGLVLSGKPVKFQFSRLSPVSGIKRVFSRESLVNLLKLSAISGAIGWSAWQYTGGSLARFAGLADMPLLPALSSGFDTLSTGLAIMAGVLLAVAIADVPWQWFNHRRRLKMTRKEVRDEHKETEGDPHIKARVRMRQREIGRARMLAAVPSADAIITNPTHYAVAIRYDEENFGAPRVVAKGVDHLAVRIRELGKESGVTIVELPPLARALYAHVEVDHEVPAVLFSAVAQVLAYVFHLRHFVPGRGRMPQAPTQVDLPAGLDPQEAGQ